MEINGEKLEFGDFLIIASGNFLEFGWYCGQGRGTLQYFTLRAPGSVFDRYEEWEKDKSPNSWLHEKFTKHGFTTKVIYKTYINATYGNRICRVSNPDLLFTTGERLELYNKSKEALIKAKFLKP